MTKRVKLRNEDPSINFRLPQELREKVYQQAAIGNKTVSNYLRDHLESFLSGELIEEAIAPYKKNEFIKSNEFLQLVVWLYQKKSEEKYTEIDKIHQDKHINTLKKISQYLPNDLAREFDKVLFDMMRVKTERDCYSYKFCRTGYLYSDGFNYSRLESYIAHLGIETYYIDLD